MLVAPSSPHSTFTSLIAGQASEDECAPQVFQRRIIELKAALERPIGDASLTLQQRYCQRHNPKEPHGCPSPMARLSPVPRPDTTVHPSGDGKASGGQMQHS